MESGSSQKKKKEKKGRAGPTTRVEKKKFFFGPHLLPILAFPFKLFLWKGKKIYLYIERTKKNKTINVKRVGGGRSKRDFKRKKNPPVKTIFFFFVL